MNVCTNIRNHLRCRYLAAAAVILIFRAAATAEPGLQSAGYGMFGNHTPHGIGFIAPARPQQQPVEPGGVMNGLKSLLFGPRIGLEANEGAPVTFVEKANLFVPLAPFQAYTVNGYRGFLAGAFLGPRVGMELGERKIRTREWLGLLPVIGAAVHLAQSDASTTMVIAEVVVAGFLSRLIPAIEALSGKTMSEIERRENLRRQ